MRRSWRCPSEGSNSCRYSSSVHLDRRRFACSGRKHRCSTACSARTCLPDTSRHPPMPPRYHRGQGTRPRPRSVLPSRRSVGRQSLRLSWSAHRSVDLPSDAPFTHLLPIGADCGSGRNRSRATEHSAQETQGVPDPPVATALSDPHHTLQSRAERRVPSGCP